MHYRCGGDRARTWYDCVVRIGCHQARPCQLSTQIVLPAIESWRVTGAGLPPSSRYWRHHNIHTTHPGLWSEDAPPLQPPCYWKGRGNFDVFQVSPPRISAIWTPNKLIFGIWGPCRCFWRMAFLFFCFVMLVVVVVAVVVVVFDTVNWWWGVDVVVVVIVVAVVVLVVAVVVVVVVVVVNQSVFA